MVDGHKAQSFTSIVETTDIIPVDDEGAKEIDLLELMYNLLDNLKYIIIAAVVCAIIAAGYTIGLVTPKYQATAKLYVVNSKDSAINLSDLQIGSYLTSDYQEVFKTWEVHEMVLYNLNLDYTYKELEEMITITNPSNTRILNISITSENSKEATALANEYAKVAKKYISETMATESPNILSIALEPTEPVSPNVTLNILLGLLLGAFAAVGIIVLRFVMDDKIKTAEDIRKYAGLTTLAVIHETGGDALNISGKEKASKKRRNNQ